MELRDSFAIWLRREIGSTAVPALHRHLDERGFRLFEWYDEIIRARLGEARPILCLAGGPALGDATDPAYPVVDEARHASCIQDITRAASAGELPRNLLNVNFWLLAAPPAAPYASEAFYRPDGRTLPTAK